MATEKQVAANRENAKKSTGPKSAEGKARVSRNALTHGYTAREFCVESEDEDTFMQMAEELWESLEPEGGAEVHAFYEYLRASWNLRLIGRDEATCLGFAKDDTVITREVDAWLDSRWQKRLALLMRYRSQHMRAQRHALATLLALKKERRAAAAEASRAEAAESKVRQAQMRELLLQDKLERAKEKRDQGAGAKQSHFRGQGSGVRGQETGNTRGRNSSGKAPRAA